MSLSTHVLDTARGEPVPGMPVTLERLDATDPAAGADAAAGWRRIATGVTDPDGRLRDWVPDVEWAPGRYRLIFDTAALLGPQAFFPEAVVVFQVPDADRHYHVPLLLSPFGFTTYRGS